MYESLVKIYHKDAQKHLQSYMERYNSPSSEHFEIRIRQYNHNKEYPAFFCYTSEVILSLEKIYSGIFDYLKILQQLTPTIQHQYVLSCLVDEVHSTSEIEGIHSTHRELREVLEGKNRHTHFSSIMKKYDLLSGGEYPSFETCEDVRNFYDEFNHLDAISSNPKNRLDGKIFRKDGVDVKSQSGKTIHRGIEPESRIIETLTEALNFLNSEEYPVLIRIAVFHYLFVYIHPFYDGNGRTARFISSSYISQDLNTLTGLRLSRTLKINKAKYYRLLKETDSEVNSGDLTPFICGFFEFITETQQEINRQLGRKLRQLARIKAELFNILPDDKDSQDICDMIVQSSAFYGQGASMQDIKRATNKTRNTVKQKLSRLPIREITRHRVKYYKLDWEKIRRIWREKRVTSVNRKKTPLQERERLHKSN